MIVLFVVFTITNAMGLRHWLKLHKKQNAYAPKIKQEKNYGMLDYEGAMGVINKKED